MTNAFNLSQLANNTNSSGQVSLSTGTSGTLSLTTQVSGTLPVLNGGTGVTTSTGTGDVVLSASPTFTGTPLSTTAASGTNTTQIATTAFAYGTVSKTTAGYTKLANGLTLQWGGGSTQTITFPVAFSTACLQVLYNPNPNFNNTANASYWRVTSFTTTTFTTNYAGSAIGAAGYYIAIGH